MRNLLAGVALLSTLGLLAGCGKDTAPDPVDADPPPAVAPGVADKVAAGPTPPSRKPGQWEHKVSVRGQTQLMRICLDADMDKRITWWVTPTSASDCDQTELAQQPDGTWTFHSVCRTVAGGTTTTDGGAKGDFSKKYTVVAQKVTTGAVDPKFNGPLDLSIEATWIGPCPGGQRPGDIQINREVRNISEMGAR